VIETPIQIQDPDSGREGGLFKVLTDQIKIKNELEIEKEEDETLWENQQREEAKESK
jgi:hypothetical protein